MTGIQLPEKLYFTLEELATRWQCDEGDIRHYIMEGMLRPSVESSDISDGWALFDDFSGVDTWPGNEIESWRKGPQSLCWIRSSRSQRIYRKRTLPRFMYINGRHVNSDLASELRVTVLENLEGKEFGICNYSGIFKDEENPVECEIRRLIVTERYDSPWITREERDRFEREHGMADTQPTRSDVYSTVHIEVMHEAIAKFFEPRHSVDPKKAEVVEWVNGRLAEKGCPSDNIAQAIFTMIKPTDHSPRKRRD